MIGIIAIVIPILLTYFLLYPPMFPTHISTSQSSTQSSAQGVTITIPSGIGDDRALNFQSDNVTVAPGTTITFVNDDTSVHDIHFTSLPPGVTLANNPSREQQQVDRQLCFVHPHDCGDVQLHLRLPQLDDRNHNGDLGCLGALAWPRECARVGVGKDLS